MVARARKAQLAWAERAVADRVTAIAEVKRRLLARAEEIADLLHRECGKPVEEAALAECCPTPTSSTTGPRPSRRCSTDRSSSSTPSAYPGKLGKIRLDPRGVVALITPWNYPVAIPLRTLIPALLAGNAVVCKPSEVAARSGALVASLFEGPIPEGVLQIVQGGGDAAPRS